jgi:hypothetical protein
MLLTPDHYARLHEQSAIADTTGAAAGGAV